MKKAGPFPESFTKYEAAVDAACWRLFGLGVRDLSDFNLADWFDAKRSPVACAKAGARNSGAEF
jgi:hypothetical protein